MAACASLDLSSESLVLGAVSALPSTRLLGIIRFQAELAKVDLDPAEVIRRVAGLAQTLTGASGAAVEMAEGDEMVYRATSGTAEKQLGLRLAQAGSLSGLCVARGIPLYCEDSEIDPRVDRHACRAVGLRSMVVVPLRHGDQTVGVLKVLSPHPRAFSEADLLTLELISDVVACTLAHARSYIAQVETVRDLFRRATEDSLTGLGNHALFYDRFHQAMKLARRQGQVLGLALVDMDGLKHINDLHGHLAGNAALRTLAGRLRALVRESDTVARLGGDEFGILLASLTDSAAARGYAHKLADQVCGSFSYDGHKLDLRVSVGAVVFPDDGLEIESLFQLADQAMYAMKRTHHSMRV
ncbi:MAG TPA: sensor domain-containing diguanylate cyclase [Geothrix sp.]|nr:sensor domain-containing diguanylate cyclase [Geothrix sp.]